MNNGIIPQLGHMEVYLMSRRYSPNVSKDVERAMRKRKRGTLKSGKGGRGGKVRSRKQAIAIGLSEALKKGAKVPRKSTRKAASRAAGSRKRKKS